jgi:[lysine-biosynthesis-protein LysW]---L-2-aminoadipate ligase
MRFAAVACRSNATNEKLAEARFEGGAWEVMTPQQALAELRAGDAALGRLDVLPTLDGVDDGVWALGALEARGVVVLNEAASLLATHDKLLTARLLRRHGVPHPATGHVRNGRGIAPIERPVVLKPRFGSWGREVYRCETQEELDATIELVSNSGWYQQHGAIVQDLVPPQGYDLRVIVAGDRVVGAAFRVAAPGEWRTNVALGGVRRPVPEPPIDAGELAIEAARAAGAALVGVDLLPLEGGGWTVAELNGAVDFTSEYSFWSDVFGETAAVLAETARERLRTAATDRRDELLDSV